MHTSGPWIVNDDPNSGDGLNILDIQGRRVAHTSAVRNIAGKVIKNPIDPREARDNAHLIADAPKMLEALHDLMSAVARLAFDDARDKKSAAFVEAWDKARDAIGVHAISDDVINRKE